MIGFFASSNSSSSSCSNHHHHHHNNANQPPLAVESPPRVPGRVPSWRDGRPPPLRRSNLLLFRTSDPQDLAKIKSRDLPHQRHVGASTSSSESKTQQESNDSQQVRTKNVEPLFVRSRSIPILDVDNDDDDKEKETTGSNKTEKVSKHIPDVTKFPKKYKTRSPSSPTKKKTKKKPKDSPANSSSVSPSTKRKETKPMFPQSITRPHKTPPSTSSLTPPPPPPSSPLLVSKTLFSRLKRTDNHSGRHSGRSSNSGRSSGRSTTQRTAGSWSGSDASPRRSPKRTVSCSLARTMMISSLPQQQQEAASSSSHRRQRRVDHAMAADDATTSTTESLVRRLVRRASQSTQTTTTTTTTRMKKRVTFSEQPDQAHASTLFVNDDDYSNDYYWSSREIRQMLGRAQRLAKQVALEQNQILYACYGFGSSSSSFAEPIRVPLRRHSSLVYYGDDTKSVESAIFDQISILNGEENPDNNNEEDPEETMALTSIQMALHYYFQTQVEDIDAPNLAPHPMNNHDDDDDNNKEKEIFFVPHTTTLRGLERHICFAIQDYQSQCVQAVIRRQEEILEDDQLWTPAQREAALAKQSYALSQKSRRFARYMAKGDSASVGTKHGRTQSIG